MIRNMSITVIYYVVNYVFNEALLKLIAGAKTCNLYFEGEPSLFPAFDFLDSIVIIKVGYWDKLRFA